MNLRILSTNQKTPATRQNELEASINQTLPTQTLPLLQVRSLFAYLIMNLDRAWIKDAEGFVVKRKDSREESLCSSVRTDSTCTCTHQEDDEELSSSSGRHHKSQESKRVSFSQVHILLFPVELGDNPSCSNGLPIQLGSRPTKQVVIDLEILEHRKEGHRRDLTELRLELIQRQKLLRNTGKYSTEELADQLYKADLERKKQKRSAKKYQFQQKVSSVFHFVRSGSR